MKLGQRLTNQRDGRKGHARKIDTHIVHCQSSDGSRWTWNKSHAKRMKQRREAGRA